MNRNFYPLTLLPAFLTVLLFTASCGEVGLPPVADPPDARAGVYAGRYDTSFVYHEFATPREITATWDSRGLYAFGTDSLDLNLDDTYDLVLELYLLNNDSLHLLNNAPPDTLPRLIARVRNGLAFATATLYYPQGLGHTGSFDYVAAHVYEDRIDTLEVWFGSANRFLNMWFEDSDQVTTPPPGPWHDLAETRYLCVRMPGKKYGWVEIDTRDPYSPLILRYALQR